MKKKGIGLQTAVFAVGTLISLLIFLVEADYFEYMEGMPLWRPDYILRVRMVIGRIAEDLQYRGFFWGVFMPFIVPMLVTIVLTVVVGKIQKKNAAAEAAHQAAQQETARQMAQNQGYAAPKAAGGTAAELKAFKELLDSGAITPEEYEAKKKQLLGL